jgi:DNA phosphorothioation-dependent restriction protein DptG
MVGDFVERGLKNEIAKNIFDNKQILLEAKTIFPALMAISLANHAYYFQNDSTSKRTVLVYKTVKDLPSTDKQKLADWLKKRLSLNSLAIFYDGKN